MMESIQQVTEPDDPRRCQASAGQSGNQCLMVALDNLKYCKLHAGRGNGSKAKEELRNYRLTKWQTRVNELADSGKVKSLREEIGILRLTLENMLERCTDSAQLVMFSSPISKLVLDIDRVVRSCERLEIASGLLIDKSTALNLSSSIIDILCNHITDTKILENISTEITALFDTTEQKEAKAKEIIKNNPEEAKAQEEGFAALEDEDD